MSPVVVIDECPRTFVRRSRLPETMAAHSVSCCSPRETRTSPVSARVGAPADASVDHPHGWHDQAGTPDPRTGGLRLMAHDPHSDETLIFVAIESFAGVDFTGTPIQILRGPPDARRQEQHPGEIPATVHSRCCARPRDHAAARSRTRLLLVVMARPGKPRRPSTSLPRAALAGPPGGPSMTQIRTPSMTPLVCLFPPRAFLG